MPVTWDDEVQDKSVIWDDEKTPHELEQEQAEIMSRPAIPAWAPIEKEEAPGFFKSLARGAYHPIEATGRGAREIVSDDDLLTNDLMKAAYEREKQTAPTTAGKVGGW